MDSCYFFLFPVGGGRVLARKSQDFQNAKTPIGYHDLLSPKISPTKICICDGNNIPLMSKKESKLRRKREESSNDPFGESNDSSLPAQHHLNIKPIRNQENTDKEGKFLVSRKSTKILKISKIPDKF